MLLRELGRVTDVTDEHPLKLLEPLISVRPSLKTISLSDEQPLKTFPSRETTPLGIKMDVSLEQPWKVLDQEPSIREFVGIVAVVRDEQPLNAYEPKVLTLFGIVTSKSAGLFPNASKSIVTSPSLRVSEERDLQLLKHCLPMVVTPEGITKEVMEVA